MVTKPDCSSSSGGGVGGGGSGTSVPDLGGQQSVISSILRAPPITTRGGAAGQVSGKVMPQRPQQPQPQQETNRSGLYLNLFCLPPEGQGMLRFLFFFLGLLSKFVVSAIVSAEDFLDNFVLTLWNRKFRISKKSKI